MSVGCAVAVTPFVLDIAGEDPAEVAIEIAVAGSQLGDGGEQAIWSGLTRKCPMYSLPFCGTDFHHCLHSSFIRERAIRFR